MTMFAPESFACQQAWRLGVKWDITHGPTHARMWQLLLWWSHELMGLQAKRNSLSQTLTANISLLSTPHKQRFDFPFTPFHVISLCVLFTVFPGTTFLICCITKQQLSRSLSLFGVFWTVCMEQWGEVVSDYLEAAKNSLWYLSSVRAAQQTALLVKRLHDNPTSTLMVRYEQKEPC